MNTAIGNAASSSAIASLRRLRIAAGPPLAFGLRLSASVSLALYVAFWLQLDNAFWAGTSAAIVCQPQLGASLRKGWFRLVGTIVGAIAIVVLTACFPQDRFLFLASLALWGALCSFIATLLRNFAAYAAALAGYTAAIIASDQLGATGGVNGDAFMLGITRGTEICIGIVSAGVILAGTDFGDAPRRLAVQFGSLSADIMGRFVAALAMAGADFPHTQAVRREFTRQVIALDPIIDQSLGESSRLRYHSPILQRAVDGLFAALTGWRAVANHLVRLPLDQAQQLAEVILQEVGPQLQASLRPTAAADWLNHPIRLHRLYEAAVQRLVNLRADTPSLRLLADHTADTLAGIADALNGLALLVADPARSLPGRGSVRLRVADWLPALVNAGRTAVTIGAAELFWVVTAWPNGAAAITFTAVTVILLAPLADMAYVAAVDFSIGTLLAAVCAAIIDFGVLPALHAETFIAFSLVIGIYLAVVGILVAQPPRPRPMFLAMVATSVPLLGPANQESYDTVQFYNQAMAIVVGVGISALAFRLLPPLSPAFRTRRLLALTLRDLRRLAAGHVPSDWVGRIFGRLSAMPDQATPLQRGQLVAAFSVGSKIIRLRQIVHGPDFDVALAALAQGDSAAAVASLTRFDTALATQATDGPGLQTVLRARAGIVALSEALSHHAEYFGGSA